MLTIRFDKDKLKKLERELRNFPRALPKVMSRALTRTAKSARTEMSRSLTSISGLGKEGKSSRAVLKRLKLSGATYSNWRAFITVSKRRFGVIELKAKKTTKGVTYMKAVGRKRVLIRHAFIATMKSGHKGVFGRAVDVKGQYVSMERSHAKEKYGTEKKEAIYELRGPSLAQLWTADMVAEVNRIQAESGQRLQKNIHDQVNLILKRKLPA